MRLLAIKGGAGAGQHEETVLAEEAKVGRTVLIVMEGFLAGSRAQGVGPGSESRSWGARYRS